jgi:two-component system OmpR family response regulator
MGSLIQWPFGHRVVSASCQAPTLLIVEDDRQLRSALITLFAQRGLTAFVATDGTAVIRHLLRSHDEGLLGRIDVVIADVDTPGRSGLDILATVRANDWPVRVVLTSRLADRSLRAQVLRLGAEALMVKPRTPGQWRRVLQAVA